MQKYKPMPEVDLLYIYNGCRDLWPLLDKKRIFITGGTGFIGRWMVESLLYAVDKTGYEMFQPAIQLLERSGVPKQWLDRYPKLSTWYGDVRDFKFGSFKPDYILHLAGGDFDEADVTADVIVNGARQVIELGATTKLLNASSGAAGNPNTAYGCSKRISELLCEAAPFSTVSARIYACIGPGLQLDRKYAVGNFIADGLAGRPITVRGNRATQRSYIYASDLAVHLWRLLLDPTAIGRKYVGSTQHLYIGELAEMVGRHYGVDVCYNPDGKNQGASYYVPYKKDVYGTTNVTWQEGLAKMIQWYKENK